MRSESDITNQILTADFCCLANSPDAIPEFVLRLEPIQTDRQDVVVPIPTCSGLRFPDVGIVEIDTLAGRAKSVRPIFEKTTPFGDSMALSFWPRRT